LITPEDVTGPYRLDVTGSTETDGLG
jgi:hypothetical protein